MTAKSKKKAVKKAVEPQQLVVEYRDPASLEPDPRNARKHSPQQIAELRASIRAFGFTNPVLLRPTGMIGAGHGRWEAAKLEGLQSIPTITLHLSEAQWRAYALADNKIPLGATWDLAILGEELEAIQASDLDLVGLGFETFAAELSPGAGEELETAGRTGTRVNQTIIHFDVVFDDEEQQAVWFAFVRALKEKHKDLPSLGARLARVLPKVKL